MTGRAKISILNGGEVLSNSRSIESRSIMDPSSIIDAAPAVAIPPTDVIRTSRCFVKNVSRLPAFQTASSSPVHKLRKLRTTRAS